jgi:hypothetical protein
MAAPAFPGLRADFRALQQHPGAPQQHSGYRTVAPRAAADVKQPLVSRSGSGFTHYVTHLDERIIPVILGALFTATIVFGWLNRGERYLTPQNGLGYWLGIAGAASVLLLVYPLRKRLRIADTIDSPTLWFRLHMALGLVAPALILFHANFRFGSFNSNMALLAMLIVAASGLVGRFLHAKIHLGLYGPKATMQQILADADALRGTLCDGLPVSNRIIEELNTFVRIAMIPRMGVLANLWSDAILNVRAYAVRRRLSAEVRRLIKSEARRHGWSWQMRRERLANSIELTTLHLAAVKKAAAFGFYQRLFDVWRALHLPLFFFLLLTAGAHIVVVHFY